jgi:hypothetical protein
VRRWWFSVGRDRGATWVSEVSMKTMEEAKPNRYSKIVERIFFEKFKDQMTELMFSREDIVRIAKRIGVKLPKNLGDVIYSFRYRAQLPESIRAKAPKGCEWIIRPAGRSKYIFVATSAGTIRPSVSLVETKIPDATPGIIAMYALNDEQALLAKLRYNRLIDVFTGVTCYSLQSHLRTFVDNVGQIETDEIYVGVDKRGAHYVFPVQAKGSKDRISVVQIEQDTAMCRSKFPNLICRPIAAQFMKEDIIALFELEQGTSGIGISSEKHYLLVEPDNLSPEELAKYAMRNLE